MVGTAELRFFVYFFRKYKPVIIVINITQETPSALNILPLLFSDDSLFSP